MNPTSFVQTKYYLKFSVSEDYTDVSGTIGIYEITSAGKILMLPQRNRDYTLKTSTFSIKLFSTTPILTGMRFKATRTVSGVETIIFKGFVEDKQFDEDKNEYSLKIAHEFKLLQNTRIAKSELESVLTGGACTYVLKTLFERALDSTIDFSIAETYEPVDGSTESLEDAFIYLNMLWCAGLDYASSDPDETQTSTYWEVFSQLIGLLGCVVVWDGVKYVVYHNSQVENFDDSGAFIDKYKNTFTNVKNYYIGCNFPVSWNSDLTKYEDTTEDSLDQTFRIGTYGSVNDFEISGIVNNLLPYFRLTPSGSNISYVFGVGEYPQKEYLNPYNKIQLTTDFTDEGKLAVSKSYDPINDNMSIEQHEVYDFRIVKFYYYNSFNVKTDLSGSSELDQTDSVYVQFSEDLDENSKIYVDVVSGAPPNGTKQTTTKTFLESDIIKLNFVDLSVGSYYLQVRYTIKSIEQVQLFYPITFGGYYVTGFSIIEEVPI